MGKLRLNTVSTMEETFENFIISRKARGVAEKTMQSYKSQFKAIARHLEVTTDMIRLQIVGEYFN